MPDFTNPFNLKNFRNTNENGKLSLREIVTALRQAINLENEATAVYRYLADNCDHALVRSVMNDIANEEVVHIGEILRLIFELDNDENELYKKGFNEVKEMMRKGL